MKLSPKTLLKYKIRYNFRSSKKSFKIFPRLTLKALKILEKGKLKTKQIKFYFAQRSDKDSKINWNLNAKMYTTSSELSLSI